MSERHRAWVSWSSGKDSTMALAAARADPDLDVLGLLVTVDASTRRVPVHEVPLELVRAQARALGLPLRVVELPWPCANQVYEDRLGAALAGAASGGVDRLVFGDLHLADIRAYRDPDLRRPADDAGGRRRALVRPQVAAAPRVSGK
jgi:diphthamide synthase (EF-2-diphthine--ammonia ligase)